MTDMDTKLTDLEKQVIKAYKDDDHVGDYGWESPEAAAWVDDFHIDAGMDGRTFSGVMSSLQKKGVIWTNGEAFGLTEMGRELAQRPDL